MTTSLSLAFSKARFDWHPIFLILIDMQSMTKAALLRGLRAGASRSSSSSFTLRSRSFVNAPLLQRALVGRTVSVSVGERSTTARAWTALGSASLSSAAATGSAGERIAVGDRVVLQVDGSLSNGEKFGQTERPLTFLVGSGDVLPGIEEAVVGLRKGERKSVEIAPAKAFGAEKQIHTVPRAQLNLRCVAVLLATVVDWLTGASGTSSVAIP